MNNTTTTIPTAVTIYPDRARVTRSGRFALAAGLQRLEITHLPLALAPESVRAAGRGTSPTKLIGITTRLEHWLDTPAQAARELEEQIQAAEDANADLAARATVLEKEQKHLDGLAAQSEMFARGMALRNRTPEEQAAVFEFISRRSDGLQTQLLRLARDRRSLAKEIDRLRRELSDLQAARPKQRYVAIVELDAGAAGEFDLELTYVVSGASWQPLYDLRLSESRVEMTYLAQIAQNTGEDWPNVALTLSTARPALALEIPKLEPWYIRPRPVPVAPALARKAMVPTALSAPPAPASAALEPRVEAAPVAQAAEETLIFEAAGVSPSGAALTYGLAARADVPGNNDPRKSTVAGLSLPCELSYVTAPKIEPVCYRRAELKNDSSYSLLPGIAQLFEADEYLGATRLEFVPPGQQFEVALGADERLRVERELVARDVDKAFMIGDRRRIRYAYTIELENLRDGPQTVFVRDQLPVSRDEQIKVKLDSAEPKPSEHTELNQLEWKLTLDKMARQIIRFDFSVEFPRALDVVGLP